MAEEMRFDIVGRDAGAGQVMRDLAKNSDLAATQVRRLADAEQAQRRASDASAAATLASAKADKILRDASDEAIASVVAQRIETEKLARTSKEAAGKEGMGALAGLGAGGVPGGAMGGMIAAGALLSPVLVSVGTGIAGFGAAAYGVAKPIEAAAQKTGGLQANMAKLNPEQQQVARGVLALGKTFGAFERQLQPEVFGVFNKGLSLAGHLLHDIQPVSVATGKALAGALGVIDTNFQSGEWQSFFHFMATTAGPDVKLLTNLFVDLANDLPPLIRDLQPVATGLLDVADAAAKSAGSVEQAFNALAHGQTYYNQSATDTAHRNGVLSNSWHWLLRIMNDTSLNALPGVRREFGQTAAPVEKTAASIRHVGQASADTSWRITTVTSKFDHLGKVADTTRITQDNFGRAAKPTVAILLQEASALNKVAAGYEHGLTPLENYIGAQITERNDLKSLNDALKLSHDRIGLNTAAQRNSFSAAQQYIQDTIKQGNSALSAHKGIDAQITSIKNALPALEHVKGKTADYRSELDLLKNVLDKLRAEKLIQEKVSVTGRGTWNVQGLPGPISAHIHGAGGFAAGTSGAPPGWAWVGEKGPELVYMRGGETVVPNHEIPGFANGVAGSYAGSPAGLPSWTAADQHATVVALTNAIAKSFASASTMAFTGGGGGGALGGSAAANRALAMRMFPWPASLFGAFDYVEMREAGYNLTARNPSSGAYGMAQFINGPAEYFQWGGNPFTAGGQLAAMFNYMNSRYGGPAGAAAHERAFNWYGNGLRGGIFTRPTVIGVGDGQPERVDVTPLGRGGGHRGALVHIENYVQQDATDVALLGQKLSFAITAAGLGS